MNISGNAAAVYESFERKLSEVNKKELLYNLAKGMLYTFTFFLFAGFVLIALEAIFNYESPVRKIFYFGFLSTSVTTIVYFISNYLLKKSGIIKPLDLVAYSKKIGNNFEEIKDRLTNSISLYQSSGGNSESVFSGELISADIAETGRITGKYDLTSAVTFDGLKKTAFTFTAAVLLYIISFSVFPSAMIGSLKRILNYNYNYIDSSLGISFAVSPGDIEIASGEKVSISVKINSTNPDFRPDEIEFFIKQITSGENAVQNPEAEDLSREPDGSYRKVLEDLNTSAVYFVQYKGIKSGEYKITVSEYPVIKNFTVSVYPPEFTGIPSKTLPENEGDIFCPEGSRIYFEIKANKNLSYAGINLNDKQVDFEVKGDGASGSFTAKESGDYKFILKDENGYKSRNLNTYTLKVIADEAPVITVIEPSESNYILNGEKELLLRARISDDYGFSKLVLGYRKIKSLAGNSTAPEFRYENIGIKNQNATSLEVPYIWVISGLGLRSGESAEYFMEVTDNTGKSVRSEIRTIQFKSLTELLKKSEEMTKELNTDFKSVFEQAEELQKEIQELKKEAQRNEELGLNEEKKQQMETKLDNFQKNLNSTQQKLDENMNEMKEKNMLNEKTLEQFMELQKMFEKINTPELQKMLEKLREALKKNNTEELKEALKNFKFDEEAFKKYMEKAMELLKKIENMQKFGELTQKLDDITKKQDELKKETENSDSNDKNKMNELSDKQKDIKDQTKDFKDELKKLIDEINKMKEQMSAEDLEKLKQQMEQKNTENKMQKSKEQLQKSEKDNSEKTQEDIMKDLNEMNENMKEALSEMMDSQDQMQKLLNKLKDIKKQLEELSRRQQELRDKTDELDQSEKEEFEQNQGEQKQLQSELSETIEELMNASKMGAMITPEMGKELGNAYNKMDKAEKDLGNKKKKDASANQGMAKESLDKAAKMLGDMIGKMGQQGKDGNKGKGGQTPGQSNMGQLMSRLGEIIAQQMGLNGKTGKMGENGKTGNNGKGNSQDEMSQMQRDEMKRLSLEQMQIQKSLEQLNEELKKEQERSGEKVLGDLDQVQKDMQEIVKELEENRFDDKLTEKQNRILSRMLDAQLSQREKDFEPKRESRSGENIVRVSPPEIVLSGPSSFNALREDFLKLQKEGYTDDYEALITKYLTELKKNGYKEN